MTSKVRSEEAGVGELRDFALSFPEAHEEFPWGERVIKVRKKVFVFLGRQSDRLYVSVKLPFSHVLALSFSFAEPTGYGLGKSGWVTAEFPEDDDPPLPLLREWIEESYRSIAPKTLVKSLDAGPAVANVAKKKTAARKSVPRKTRKVATKSNRKKTSKRTPLVSRKSTKKARAKVRRATSATRGKKKTKRHG